MRLRIAGSRMADTAAALSLSITGFGVPLGAHRPFQMDTSIGYPASAAVGISGMAGDRFAEVTA
jgi:hypothetical protein